MEKADDRHPDSKANVIAHQFFIERHFQFIIDFYGHQQTDQSGCQEGYQQQDIPEFTVIYFTYQSDPRKRERQRVKQDDQNSDWPEGIGGVHGEKVPIVSLVSIVLVSVV